MFKLKNIILFVTILSNFTLSFAMQQQNPNSSIQNPQRSSSVSSPQTIQICPMCCKPIENMNLALTLPCYGINNKTKNHTFHMGCIDQWLINHDICPKCNKKVGFLRPTNVADNNIIDAANLESVRYFVAQAKNTNQPINPIINANRETLLHLATKAGNLYVVNFLISELLKLDPQATFNPVIDSDGKTPLYIAAKKGHLPIVRLIISELLKKNPNADINPAKTSDGYTPLHVAAEQGHLPVVQFIIYELLKQNPYANINPEIDYNFGAPLEIAQQNGHHDVANFIQTSLDKQLGIIVFK